MLAVGYGNSILFRELNEQLPSFDNTFLEDEDFINTLIENKHCRGYFVDDTLVIQCKVASGDVPTCTFYDSNDLSGVLTSALKNSYSDYDFWEFTMTFSSASLGISYYFKITNVPVVSVDKPWQSEPIQIIEDDSHMYLLEWYNYDVTTGRANNNFEMDYSTGIVPFMRILGVFKEYSPKVEISVYDNLSEATKLKERVQRTLAFKTDSIPRYIAEKLTIATAHDMFCINQVAFVREEEPEIEPLESNMTQFSAVLTQQNVIGLNTSDIGFNCDDMGECKVGNQQEENVGANTSFIIPENHGLDVITVWYNGGSNVLLKFGTTVGGNQIGSVRSGASEADSNATLNVPQDLAKTGTGTLYVDVTGTAVDVDIFVRTIQNRNV